MKNSYLELSKIKLLFIMAVIILTSFLCVGCGSEYEYDDSIDNSFHNSISSQYSGNDQEMYSNKGTTSSSSFVYSTKNTARRNEENFYANKENEYSDIKDIMASSSETNADLMQRVEDYIYLMENLTNRFNTLSNQEDSVTYFLLASRLEQMALDLESEIKQSPIDKSHRKKVSNARKSLAVAAKNAWDSHSNDTMKSTKKTSQNATIQTSPTRADPVENGSIDSFVIWLPLFILLIILIGVVIFFYDKSSKKFTDGNEKEYIRLSDKKRSQISGKKIVKINRNIDAIVNADDQIYGEDDLGEDGDNAGLPNEETNDFRSTELSTPHRLTDEPRRNVYDLHYFWRSYQQILKISDNSVKKAKVRELMKNCSQQASYVYCKNENDVINSPSSTTPIFVDSDTMTMFLRFDTYLLPSPTIQSDRDKRNLSLYAEISNTGTISVICVSQLAKHSESEYELVKKGQWTK